MWSIFLLWSVCSSDAFELQSSPRLSLTNGAGSGYILVPALHDSDLRPISQTVIVPGGNVSASHIAYPDSVVLLEPGKPAQVSTNVTVFLSPPSLDRKQVDEGLNHIRNTARTTVLVSEVVTEQVDKIRHLFDFVIFFNDEPSHHLDPCVFHLHASHVCSHSFLTDRIETQCPGSPASVCDIKPRSVKLAFLGDWGAIGPGLSATAAAVASEFYDAIIFGGDNVYEIGITSPQDEKMQSVYIDHFDSLAVPQYVIEGNHDGYGNYLAQLLYSQYARLWDAPFYYHNVTISTRGTKMCLVQMDTNRWDLSAQGSFLHNVLSSMDCRESDFVIVTGHHPVFSAGGHGDDQLMVHELFPILKQYSVDLYLSGHDHTNSVHRDSGILVVVAGAASKKTTSEWYTTHSGANETLFEQINMYGYAEVEIRGSELKLNILNSESGERVFETRISSRKSERNSVHANEEPVIGRRPWSGFSVDLMVLSLLAAWILGTLVIGSDVVIGHLKSLISPT